MNEHPIVKRIVSYPWIAEVIALLGGAWYVLQTWTYAHLQESVLDEGAYLYKGYLFASGQYKIYQPYGPWSNHMPLSFLIPGYVQLLEPGIRTGRYFAILLAGLTLLGVWILARRLGNRWWAAAAMWVFALNPALPRMYSLAVSQGLVAFMLIWTLVLVMGEKRPAWQITLGSILAGLILMTRINMLVVPPFVVLYVFWQHGKRAGVISALASGLTIIIGHALFWPGILQMWASQLRPLTPFLAAYRTPGGYQKQWSPDISTSGRILSFFHGIRFHFTFIVGAIAAWILWTSKSRWTNQANFRSAVFLSTLFILFMPLHIWASLTKDYCVFCLAGYLAFFSMLGLLIIIASFSTWRKRIPWWLQIVIVLVILTLFAGIGFGTFEDTGVALSNLSVPAKLLGSSTAGTVTLGAVLTNKFNLESQTLRRLLPTAFGLGSGIVFLGLIFILQAYSARRRRQTYNSTPSFGYWALVAVLILGTILSPTKILGGGYRGYECNSDVLASYEANGAYLAQHIPPGSLVYWKGPLSAVPLLYLPNIKIFPAQINDGYSMYTSGDNDTILKFGGWNMDLALQWLKEADIILIEERSFKGWIRDAVLSGNYEEIEPSPPSVYCSEGSQILIFKRQP
jgi:4-amino-4-deoxy-L-arabinose transferase-like glycosyltransferase